MSINWVMLDNKHGFVPLPREKILFASPPRTSLSLKTPNSYPGKEPLNLSAGGGIVYITNQRLVYLPTSPLPHLQSFSAPILNLQDTHVSAPFFGPNAWTGVLKPVTGGGIPAQHALVDVKMVFKDGGAFDFHQIFEEVKERLSQAVDSAREDGRQADLSNVPLEQLPAYEDVGARNVTTPNVDAQTAPIVAPIPVRPGQASQLAPSTPNPPVSGQVSGDFVPPPDGPPPGYEEAQSTGVMNSLEESIRRQNP